MSEVIKEAEVNTNKKGDWSLGLSDEDDDDLNVNKIIGDSTDDLDNLLQDIENNVEFGPPLLQSVSTGFSKTASRPLTKESKSSLKAKIQIPDNCKEFVVPKVNSEIWRLLPPPAKIQDIKQQQNQQVVSLTLSSLASIANTVASNKEKIPKEVVNSVVTQSIDAANLLGDQFQSISAGRRHDMKKFLNPEYAGICSVQNPGSEWLFGADLAENLKSSKATSSLMRNTMNRGQNRVRPYQRSGQQGQSSPASLNWNRPLQQSRGSGHLYQPRYQPRPQGQPRMLNPQFQQQRFRKF